MVTIGKILVPVDFSPYSENAVRHGIQIGRDRSAKLYFLHVIDRNIADALRDVSGKGYKGEFVHALRKLMHERESELSSFIPEAWREGLDVELLVRKGEPSEEVLGLAKDYSVDLIVLGVSGLTGAPAASLGVVALNVASGAPCPVLLVRPVQHDFVV